MTINIFRLTSMMAASMKVHHMSLQPFVEMQGVEPWSRDSRHQGLFVRKFRGALKCALHQSVFMERTNRVATRTGCLFADFCSQNCLRSHQRPVVSNVVGHYMQWISIAVCCSQQYARPLPLVRTLDVNSTLSIPIHPQFCPDFSGIFKTPATTHSTSFS